MQISVSASHFGLERKANTFIFFGTLEILLIAFIANCISQTDTPEILFISDVNAAINPSTMQRRVIVPSQPNILLGYAALSPDHRNIAFGSGHIRSFSVWLANSDGTNSQKVSEDFLGVNFFWVDNQTLVIMGSNDDHTWPEDGEWWLYSLVANNRQPITPLLSYFEQCLRMVPASLQSGKVPLPSRDGILGHWEISNSTIKAVTDIQYKPGQIQPILCPAWTPDSQKIAYVGQTSGRPPLDEVFLIYDDGRSFKQLTHFATQYDATSIIPEVSLSPDGRWIIGVVGFGSPHSPDLPSGSQVILIDTDTRKIDFLGGSGFPDEGFYWSSDSRYVAASLPPAGSDIYNRGGEIHVIDVQTKKIRQLTFDGEYKKVFAWH